MLRRAILGMVGTLGVIGTLLAASGQRAGASQLLLNPGFEQWANGRPSGWVTSPGVTTTPSSESVAGTAVELSWGSGNARLSQTVEGVEGATYAAAASVAANTESSSTIRITFIDAGFTPLANSIQTRILSVGWESLAVQATAPSGTAFVTIAVEFSPVGPGFGRVDEASLEETLPSPTATPTPEPTATPTEMPEPTATATATSEASPTATSTSTPGATASATSSSGVATATSTATRTPTRAATATRTPTAERQATATRTPTMGPTPTSTKGPTLSSFGGMLYNGDFEDVDGERPPGWTKFGGTMLSSMDAYRGNRAVKLESDTSSTKWIYQVAMVTDGSWYRATAFAKVEGGGGAFIRLSWYESADGGGTAIGNDDSAETQGGTWRQLDTGSVQAPPGAKSVRVRLMLRPSGLVTASFDDALLETSAPAAPTATAGATPRATVLAPTSNSPAASNPNGGDSPDAGPASSGTGIASGLVDTVAGAAVVAQPGGTLRLSEVLADPAETGRDAPFEWVELFNAGSEDVSLEGWGIGDGREVDKLPAVIVPARGYVVVAGRTAVLPSSALVVRVADGEIGAGLNNDGEVIRLVAPDGTEADAISFGSDTTIFDPAPPAPPAGRTLGARNPAADPDPANWAVTLQPTPGEPNTFATARTPSATAKPGGSATTGAASSNGEQPLVRVDRGERDSPIPWIVMAGAAGVGGAGAVLGWQRLGKKQRRGS